MTFFKPKKIKNEENNQIFCFFFWLYYKSFFCIINAIQNNIRHKMQFIDTPRFPDDIAYSAIGGATFNTDVVVVQSGAEKRNVNWGEALHMYDVSHGLKTQAEVDKLKAFFLATKGRAIGFRFKDWQDFTVSYSESFIQAANADHYGSPYTHPGGLLGVTIWKRYEAAAGGPYSYRQIMKVVNDTMLVKVNGVERTSNFTFNSETGILAPIVALAPSSNITFSCEFDVPVRFDTDQMKVSIDDYLAYTWGQIPIVELRLL